MDLSHWIERNADFAPDKAALRFEGAIITYAELEERIKRLAGALSGKLGVKPGDRVAHIGYNSPELVDLLFACARIGAILVPLNWRLAGPELRYIIQDCGASVLLGEAEFRPTIDGIREELDLSAYVGYGAANDAAWQDYDGFLNGAEPAPTTDGVGDETPVLIVYTSGTTGRPKGAVLDQGALFVNAVNSAHLHDMTSQDIILTNLPMFHVGGMNIQTTPGLHTGATVVIQRRFEPGDALAAIREYAPTLVVAVPATMLAMFEHPDWEMTDFGSVRTMMTGSTNVPVPLIRAYQERGLAIGQVYGSSETAPLAIVLKGEQGAAKLGSAGLPALHCDARIVDANGRDVPQGERGEILIRGRNILREYWNKPEATADSLRNGWFHTGDVGYQDEDGFYFVVDRKKDMIISGSENIYPAELEAVLAECDAIQEGAVVGRPDEKWGEVAVAVIVRKQGVSFERDDLMALFDGTLARYKHPRDVLFVDALPRNAMGKVLKFEIRKMVTV